MGLRTTNCEDGEDLSNFAHNLQPSRSFDGGAEGHRTGRSGKRANDFIEEQRSRQHVGGGRAGPMLRIYDSGTVHWCHLNFIFSHSRPICAVSS